MPAEPLVTAATTHLASEGWWDRLLDGGDGAASTAPLLIALGLLAIAVVVLLVLRRRRRRRRAELFATIVDSLEPLLVTPVAASSAEASVPVDATSDTDGARPIERADEVRDAGQRLAEALAELERLSRFETSAAALALRHHATELASALESRLRGGNDPYLLEVRITELRERVRGARDRLDAAVGA